MSLDARKDNGGTLGRSGFKKADSEAGDRIVGSGRRGS